MPRLYPALVVLLLPAIARPETLEGLLARGPVVLVESDPKGAFSSATGVIGINAPIEKVWTTILDFSKYKDFVPKVVGSKIVKGEGTTDPEVRWEIDTPVINTVYNVHYHPAEASHMINAEQVSGALKDSHWEYRVEPDGPGRTLIYYKSQARHFSSLLEGLEDSQQTITIGVNVGGALGLLRALKVRSEKGS
jgi:ribosome-associated toxin RatA of RatAB toxin-antitoxin module